MLEAGAEKSESVRSEQDSTASDSCAYSVTVQSGALFAGVAAAKAATGRASAANVNDMVDEKQGCQNQLSVEDLFSN